MIIIPYYSQYLEKLKFDVENHQPVTTAYSSLVLEIPVQSMSSANAMPRLSPVAQRMRSMKAFPKL